MGRQRQSASVSNQTLRDVTGFRGERVVELHLTDYEAFAAPLFKPAFLGDKWPTIDFYVELNGVPGMRPYFFVQAKSTTRPLIAQRTGLEVAAKADDVSRLLDLPGPTYILGVHEKSRRVFARSVHAGTPRHGISRISLANELTPDNLRKLHSEVVRYWQSTTRKPLSSAFL